jgi:argininosuccinate lyase
MPHKKNPDVFELIRGKCNVLQGLPQQLALLTTNLPSGYHRDLQLSKELIVPALQELKSCIEMATFTLKDVKVNENILDDDKYDYLFSVDTLNHLVQSGMPFRDAYKKIGLEIQAGNFTPNKEVIHTHEGSLGNLCLENIKTKMESALKF